MPGCGFCTKAKSMFKNEIKSGEIVLKPHTQAPPGVNGFPTFQAPSGKMHSGLPSSKDQLYSKLELVIEGYSHHKSPYSNYGIQGNIGPTGPPGPHGRHDPPGRHGRHGHHHQEWVYQGFQTSCCGVPQLFDRVGDVNKYVYDHETVDLRERKKVWRGIL